MKKNLLITLSIFISFNFFSQSFLKHTIIETYTDTCIHYKQTVSGINIPANAEIYCFKPSFDGTIDTVILVSLNDTIISDYDVVDLLATVNDSIIANPHPDLINFQIISYTEPTSIFNSDGQISILFDSIPKDLIIKDANSIYYSLSTTDSLLFNINNLRFGIIQFECFYVGNHRGFIGNPNYLYNNSLEVVIDEIDSDSNNCSGSIEISPLNATGNVTYKWGIDSTLTTNSIHNLCPGMYSVFAMDDAQKVASLQIPVLDSSFNYYDNSVNTYQAGDTVYYEFLNCQLNYNLPIDSISFSETLLTQNWQTASYLFSLTVYQDTSTFIFSDTLFVYADSNIYMDIAIYCQLFKSSSNSFKGKRVEMIRHGAIATSLSESTKNEYIKISPNPTTGMINIDKENVVGKIYDTEGRELLKINSNSISIENLKNGIYYLQIDGQIIKYKIIKI